MTTQDDIVASLRTLSTPAPEVVTERTLVATGHYDQYDTVDGPTGPLAVAFNGHGVSGVVPISDPEAAAADLAAKTGRTAVPGVLPSRLRRAIERVLATGKLGGLAVDTRSMSPFQVRVLEKAAEIPPGELRPYGWLAREIGRPEASRAVGTALARNPIPVLLPCHRVSRGDGSVGNYAFGPAMKRALLVAEGLQPERYDDIVDRGVRYLGTDTTDVFCLPTCRHARRVADSHRQEFRTLAAAEAAGKRPCKVCRPAGVAA
jgi:O-6-methylguanine DNA methyltransferase